jgi:hypothetical protein
MWKVILIVYFQKNPTGPQVPGCKFLRVVWEKEERKIRAAIHVHLKSGSD